MKTMKASKSILNQSRTKQAGSLLELLAIISISCSGILYIIDLLSLLNCALETRTITQTVCRAASKGTASNMQEAHANVLLHSNSAPAIRAASAMKLGLLPANSKELSIEIRETVCEPIPRQPLGGELNGHLNLTIRRKFRFPVTLPALPPVIAVEASQAFPFTWKMPTNTRLDDN